jgi:serine O-acetyltransferase
VVNRDKIAENLLTTSCKLFKGRSCYPNPEAISQIIRLLQQVLLPNYFTSMDPDDFNMTIEDLHGKLSAQIHRAMFQTCYEENEKSPTRDVAEEKANQLIAKLPDLQEMLFEDVVETYHSDPAATGYDEIILTYPGIFALSVYRVAHVLYTLPVPLLPRMMTEYAHRLTGVDLHPGATIGRGIMIDHGTGIVVGETTIVGNHVRIYQGVTLGALYFPRDEAGAMVRTTKRHPTVEDDVILYANATVLGGKTTIGHHSVIGSNAWVTESVDPHSKVLYQTETIVHSKQG